MIVAEESYEVSEPSIDSHIVRLKSTGADILYDVSIPKFAAQAIKKMSEMQWKPLHILNSVAGSVAATMKPAGFENSQDIVSSAWIMDPNDAQWKDNPNMKEWVAFMDQWLPSGDKTDANNIYGYNVARTLVQVLKQCGDELTRANIMKQAANMKDFEPGTLLPGIKVNTSPTDFYPVEQERLMRFKGETWELFGPVLSGDVAG